MLSLVDSVETVGVIVSNLKYVPALSRYGESRSDDNNIVCP